jgi:TolB protein
MRGEKVLVGMLLICAVILLSTVIMPIGIANAEDIEYPVDYYGVMQPLRIATTEEPAYSGDHTYTADTLGTTDNPSRGTMLKALIWPPMGKSISSPITKVKVVTYIECIDGDYNSQSLEYRLYAYNLETGELTKKIHDDTWPRTGNTPTYFPLSYGLKTYDDTIICDTKKSALGEKETLILVSICHTFGAKSHHTKYAAHFDTKDYPAYMEVFTSDGKSTKYYIHDSFTTPSVASTGKIVYDSDESGNGDIWVMDADGSNKVRLTDDPERECLPRWSPNGKRIAYCKKDNDGTFDLWIMDSDGTNQRKIYDGDCTGGFYRISWLPDGSKVYFDPGYYAGGGGMPHKICWVDPDGPSTQLEHDLTPLAHPSWLYSEPDISRDGTKITFVHWEGHSWSYNNEIYMGDLSPEGDSVSNIVRLTTNSERDGHPSLSPDNSEIVWGYHSDIWNIWIMNVDGSNPHSLTSDFSKEMAYTPSFSSNGQKIIFAASRNGYYDIWMMTIDGTELTQLTNTDDITECRPDFTSPTPTQEGTCGRITNWKTKCQGVYSPGQKVGAEMEFESLMGGGYNFKGVIIIRSPTEDEYTNSEVEWVPSAPNPQGKFAAGDALYVTIPEGASAGNYDMKLELWNDDTDKLCDVTEWKDDLFTVEGGDTPSNLLENPGFESGELDPWYSTKYYDPYDKCDWISIGVDSEAPYEGGYGAYIDIRCSLDAWGRIIQEPIEITPGESLAVEAKLMYKGDLSDGYAELWLVFLDADKKSLDHVYKKYYESDFDAEGKWLSALLPATTAPSNAKYVRIMVGLADVKSCRLNIDDVIFKSGSTTGNHPPSATKIEPTSDSITIEPGDTQEFKVKAEDVDEEEHNNLKMIEWFLDDLRMETGAADGTSEEVSFTYTFEDVDTFYVKATVYDEQMEEDSVTWDVNVGIAPKIIGFTQVPSNPVGTGEVYYVVTYKNDEQGEGFVTLDIQEGNKVVKEPIEYIKGHGQLSDASKAAIKGNMAFIFEKVLDKLVDKGLLDFFNDYLGQDLDSFLEEEDAIGFKIFSQVYASDDYGEDYDIKVIVEDEEGKDSKALTTNVREYYIGIIKEEIEDTNNNPDDGRQIEGIINIPFNYCLPSHDAYIIFVGGEKIIEAYTGKVKSPNAKVMLPKFHLSDGTPRLKHLVKKGKENIKLTTHLFKKPQETKTKIEIVLVDDEGTEYSDDVTLDFQNNYYVNPNWEGRFTEYRRGNEIFKADLTKSQFEEEFKDTNVLRLTKEVEENLNNNKYYDGAYIPDEQRGYANNLMSFEAAELEFVGKNEIEDVKWINDIWEIYGWFGHMKTGVEILVEGADFVTNFNPTKFLLKTLAEEGIGCY